MTTISIRTAKKYLDDCGISETTVKPLGPSRMEYLKLLGEAFEEGKLMRENEAAQFTKAEFAAESFWQQYDRELVEEFYISYRRGFIAGAK